MGSAQSDTQRLIDVRLRSPSLLMRRRIIRLAIPNIVSNITVPLLALVDVGLAGHTATGGTSIGAVAVASGAVSTLYWLFGFLRMGTTGFVARCFGAKEWQKVNRHLAQGITMALLSGLLLLLMMPLVLLFVRFMAQRELVLGSAAVEYARLALCGAPAAMLLYVFNGWFIGMQNTRVPMLGAITINLLNISLSYLFVHVFKMGVRGLALGTIIAQYSGMIFFSVMARYRYWEVLCRFRVADLWHLSGGRSYFTTHRDLFVRSALLSAVTLFFTYASTSYGEEIVAANTLLLQLFNLFSYFMDGFAYAGEALTGRYLGMRRKEALQMLVRQLFSVAVPLTLGATLLYFLFPEPFLSFLSDSPQVVETALRWSPFVAFVPLVGFAAFLWDGIFVGATYAKGLLWSMLLASACFFSIYWGTRSLWGVASLWLAFDVYLAVRGLVQWLLWHRHFATLLQESNL